MDIIQKIMVLVIYLVLLLMKIAKRVIMQKKNIELNAHLVKMD